MEWQSVTEIILLHVLLFQGGIVLLLMGVCLTVVQKSVGRKLSVELGGKLAVHGRANDYSAYVQVLNVFKLSPLWWWQL